MRYCENCGKEIGTDTRYCPSCGTSFGQKQAVPEGSALQTDAEQNKLYGILSYFGFLAFISILAAPKSAFARFHANQGLVLFLTEIFCGITGIILNAVLFAISRRLVFIGTLWSLVWIPLTILSISGIISAAQGTKKELPVIGKFRIIKN